MYDKSIVTGERIAELRIKRDAMRCERFAEVEKNVGKACADAIKYLYELYGDGMLFWLADLWEPEIGGFYFSSSARDTEGFLPDIESTVQALVFLETSGLTSSRGATYKEAVTGKMREAALRFAKGLQDEDGYFYHPQWGKDITVSRRGRDLGWSTSLIRELGDIPNYPTPLDKKDGADSPSTLLPEHLRSIEKFREYLAERDLMHKSYAVGNLIQSQTTQIKAAGKEFVDELVRWYTENQNPENGLWQEDVCYHSTNGLMKVCLTLNSLGVPIPHPEEAMRSAQSVLLSGKSDPSITSFYNPWITMHIIFDSLNKFGEKETKDRLHDEFMAKAPEMIIATADRVREFRKEDGSFSYSPDGGRTGLSQGAPVCPPQINEGGVNGNSLASTGVVRNVCRTLGIPVIPFFTPEDSKLFFELIESSYPAKKIYQYKK